MNTTGTIILIVLFVVTFFLADFIFETFNLFWVDSLEKQPITIFVYGEQRLQDIETSLHETPMIRVLSTQNNREIVSKMSNRYGFTGVEDIVDVSSLPGVIQVSLVGDKFDLEQFEQFKSSVTQAAGSQGSIIYSESQIVGSYRQMRQISLFRLIYRASSLVMLFFLVLFADKKYLYGSNPYWSAYHNSGGTESRYSLFFKSSLARFYIPLFLIAALQYMAIRLSEVDYYFDIRVWLIMIGLVVVANQAAWLTNKED